MTKQRVGNVMLADVPWDGSELASPLTLPGALIAPSYIEHTQITKPANPPAGKMRLYPKADGKYYTLNSAGVEGELGGAGSVYIHPDPFSIGTLTVTTKATLKSPDITGNLAFVPDNTHDFGATAAGRPRNLYVGTNATVSGTVITPKVTTPLIQTSGTLALETTGNAPLEFKTNATPVWTIVPDGNLTPTAYTAGAADLGAPSARIRSLYLYTFIDQRQQNTPAPPAAGSIRIYPKTDGKLYMLNSANTEVEIGTGAGGNGGGSTADPLILENGLFVNDLVMMENLTFTIPGGRIKGDLSNATNSNRLMFENSVANQPSFLGIKPSGTGTGSALVLYEKSDTVNSPYGIFWNDGTQVNIGTGASGTGTPKGLSLWSDGEKWRISVSGHIFAANDNLYDIGASSAGRPQDLNLGRHIVMGGNIFTGGYIRIPQNQSISWADGDSQIMSYGRSTYFDETNSWIWRSTPSQTQRMSLDNTGYLTLPTNGMKLSNYVEQSIIATPATPPAGTMRLYPKADGKFYSRNAAGIEKPLGADDPLTLEEGLTVNGPVVFEDTTVGGNLTITGTARRIKGDFSSTVDVRTLVQTNVPNGVTSFSVIPHGTAKISTFRAYPTDVTANAPYLDLWADETAMRVESNREGTGAYVPLIFRAHGTERGRLDSTSSAWSAPSDARLNANAYFDGTNWNRYDTSNDIGHVNIGRGSLNFYTAPAGTGAPAWTNRLSVTASGASVGGSLSATSLSAPTISWSSRLVGAVSHTNTIAATPGGTGPFEIGVTGGGAAMLAFHRHGYYAAHFGLDSDNKWKVGGWSMGNASYEIVTKDANGYIFGSYINMTADRNESGSPAYVAGQNGDNYMRWWNKSLLVAPFTHTAAEARSSSNKSWVRAATTWVTRSGYWFVVARSDIRDASLGGNSRAGVMVVINGANGGTTEHHANLYGGSITYWALEIHWVGYMSVGQEAGVNVFNSNWENNEDRNSVARVDAYFMPTPGNMI